jgi:hypothetical protein
VFLCGVALAGCAPGPLPSGPAGPKGGGGPRAKAEREPFGYTAAFDEEVRRIGQISPEEFARRFAPKAEYLARPTWDPTTARYWDRVQADPKKVPASTTHPSWGPPFDFRLNAQEVTLLRQNGFVVCERLGDQSCSDLFYRVYSRDLPVFVSADAVLHAWHRSYDALLEETEALYLARSLDEILGGMAGALPAARGDYGDGPLAAGVRDADYFLAVARSLLAGKPVAGSLGQDERVARTVAACDAEQLLERFVLFGRERTVDFSQFKPRGHYTRSEQLKRYFRAMMWCGRIDLRVAGTDPRQASPRELAGAIVLHDLLRRSGQFERWRQFDHVLETFVGRPDSMTFAHLGGLLEASGIRTPADVKDPAALETLQAAILAGKLGMQDIRGHVYYSPPFGPGKAQLPRSFTVIGQRFVVDSWALAKVVYDDVIWDDEKVKRRVPSGLDVAFAALGNDQVVPELTARMTNADGRRFRDGLNYQHNLAAVRRVIDGQDPAAWDTDLYTNWLACLRELSRPTTAAAYPEAMRTRGWALKTVNTQLASWAQLRHDTVLYAKQSYTGTPACSYPAGFVEPLPHFWDRFRKMAARAADLIAQTPYPDYTEEKRVFEGFKDGTERWRTEPVKRSGKELNDRQAAFLRNFAAQLAVLAEISRKEQAQQELTAEETRFLNEVVQLAKHGSGQALHGGWYPGLFYRDRFDAAKWDALLADVHTDPPDDLDRDPGCVLHEGVGNVDLLVIAVDSGTDRMVYLGPVLSHYEFEMQGTARRSDQEWQQILKDGKEPPRPEWTKGYLAPGRNEAARHYFSGGE